MLSIGMLNAGDEDYYLAVGAGGPGRADEYYSEAGASPGTWVGAGSPTLGLSGQVQPADLRGVLAGRHPSTGEPLVSAAALHARRRPGLFLTFSAPKGVSLIAGLGDPQVRAAVEAAQAAAVGEALGYLERNHLVARRGRDGVGRVATGGMVAAGFVHRTSRAGDPQWHTHVLVANVVQGADGRWSAPDSRSLFRAAKTAGFVYQAALRAELTARLGLGWGPVRNGMGEPAGIPGRVLREFSTRRRQIEARLDTVGQASAAAAQVAAYRTRQAKDTDISPSVLAASWQLRAADAGLDRLAVTTLVGPGRTPTPIDLPAIADRLLGPAGLTARHSSFDRPAVIRALAEAAGDGATTASLEAAADTVLADPRVRLLATPDVEQSDDTQPDGPEAKPALGEAARYTTAELLAVEARVLQAAAGRRSGYATVPAELQRRVLAGYPSLTGEQRAAVTRLLGEGEGVAVVVGRAGTGKTFALDAARAGWAAAGMAVVGAAPSARAAAELQAGSGIPSTTLARLLLDADLPADWGGGLPPGGVVVVDEAGMAGTRTLDRLVALAGRSHTKLVLVGDPAQLPEIDAGGCFAALASATAAPELVDNRRQHEPWERDALTLLRAGNPAAMEVYRSHGRLVLGDTAADVRAQLVADWWQARLAGVDTGMWALRRADVDGLNRLARTVMADAGRLGSDSLVVGERAFAVGDEVVALRNDRRLGVLNGTRGTITALHPDQPAVTVTTSPGVQVVLLGDYLEASWLDHGYALTIHKAQGVTVDRAFLLGSDTLFREAGYVGMSRGRLSNDLYLVASDDPIDSPAGEHRRRHVSLDATTAERHNQAIRTATVALTVSRAQRLATLTGQPAPGAGTTLAELAALAGGRFDTLPAGHPIRQAANERRALLRRAALADPGGHLAPLGPPPLGGVARDAWVAAAQAVDAYRDRWQVTDPVSLLGAPPDRADQRADRAAAQAAVELAALAIGRPTPALDRVDDRHHDDDRDGARRPGTGWER